MSMVIDDRLSPSQAARRLEVSSEMVRRWIRSGRLIATSTSLGHLIDAASVERLRVEREERAHGTARRAG